MAVRNYDIVLKIYSVPVIKIQCENNHYLEQALDQHIHLCQPLKHVYHASARLAWVGHNSRCVFMLGRLLFTQLLFCEVLEGCFVRAYKTRSQSVTDIMQMRIRGVTLKLGLKLTFMTWIPWANSQAFSQSLSSSQRSHTCIRFSHSTINQSQYISFLLVKKQCLYPTSIYAL